MPRSKGSKDSVQYYVDVQGCCPGCGLSFIRNVNRKQSGTLKYCSYECQRRANHLRVSYGITFKEVEDFLKEQNNKCPICKDELNIKNMHIDHCHITGEVRGILCYLCNVGIGSLKDSSESLRAAADYLEKFECHRSK